MKQLLLGLIFSSTALASTDCFDAYYDLGSDAAAIGLFCASGAAAEAELFFCKRQALLDNGRCTGSRDPIACTWQQTFWLCEKGGEYPYTAKISRQGFDRILFQFKSKFNSGTREGIEIR